MTYGYVSAEDDLNEYWTNSIASLYQGDVLDVLGELPERSVQCVVTSPPYWGLRDYGTASWEGGDAECDHKGTPVRTQSGFNERYFGKEFASDKQGDEREPMGRYCSKCGAKRIDAQLGLEKTPDCLGWATKQPCNECFVCRMVAVFRGVRRVLRDDGVLFLNLGDSYAGSMKGYSPNGYRYGGYKQMTNEGSLGLPPTADIHGLKPKDLVGVPWRTALALQADGWYLRSDVIWAKPNPMPESVQDRPTKSHEYIFVLTKSQRYYWDIEAVREPAQDWGTRDRSNMRNGTTDPLLKHNGLENSNHAESGRNIRTVWNIATQPYSEAHFATFPEALVERCILASTPERGSCAECGKPWVRVVEKNVAPVESANAIKAHGGIGNRLGGQAQQDWKDAHPSKTLGWRPRCDHDSTTPATVLDPFVGSGTTALVAQKLGRKSIGIDLNQKYLDMAARRISKIPLPMFEGSSR